MKKMRPFGLSMAVLLMLLSGCATAPSASLKPPSPPARAPLGENFQEEMQRFLNGSLPALKPSDESSKPRKTESTAK